MFLFGPLAPAQDAGDVTGTFGGEGWGEGLRKNAGGGANTSLRVNLEATCPNAPYSK
jgi:hypothetical protein